MMTRLPISSLLAGLVLTALPGCGGASGSWDRVSVQSAASSPQQLVSLNGGGGGDTVTGESVVDMDMDGPTTPRSRVGPPAEATREPAPDRQTRYAEATTPDGEPRTATDGRSGPLLIYTAELQMSVHHVTDQIDRVESIGRDHGGHLSRRDDTSIEIRVPADAFEEVLAQIQELGDVSSRRIEVDDVTEEFHDIQLRISTLRTMRTRLEQMLAAAENMEAALAVEQHLERITLQLEGLEGRLRFLADRVSLSTIRVRFAARQQATEPQFQLPFRWLRQLGIERLLTLPSS